MTKTCPRCTEIKPLSEYYKTKTGYSSYCKVCMNELNRIQLAKKQGKEPKWTDQTGQIIWSKAYANPWYLAEQYCKQFLVVSKFYDQGEYTRDVHLRYVAWVAGFGGLTPVFVQRKFTTMVKTIMHLDGNFIYYHGPMREPGYKYLVFKDTEESNNSNEDERRKQGKVGRHATVWASEFDLTDYPFYRQNWLENVND